MKQIIVKLILIVIAFITLIIAIIKVSILYLNNKVSLTTMLIASKDIPPRTKITSEYLTTITLPKDFVLDYAINDESLILDKYTDIQGKIPAGSPIYSSMIYDESELPDHPTLQLLDNQSTYTMQVPKLDASILSMDQRIDIYVTLHLSHEETLMDVLLEDVRIISIKDHRGTEMNNPNYSNAPYQMTVAISTEDINLLSIAEEKGELRLFTTKSSHNSTLEAKRANSPVTNYLLEFLSPKETKEENKTE